MSKAWPKVRLGDLLRRSEETIQLQPDTEYRELTVKLWGKGVVTRGIVSGTSIAAQRRYVARASQFILSRIDARNGALGIVPSELDGAIVSNDFPTYGLATDRLLPAFLGWMCRMAWFVEACQRASEGTTNRVRLKEDLFLAIDIPLPSLEEQRRVARRIEELTARINETHSLRKQVAEEGEALLTSLHVSLAGGRTRKLGDVLTLDEDAVPVVPSEQYPQVGMKSFGAGLFPKSATCGTETTYKTFNRLHEGALVLSQVKGWEGAVAVCGKDLEGWFVSPEYRTFRCVPTEARPGYFASLVRTEWFRRQLQHATRGVGARRERTRPEQFLTLEIPMPDVYQQERAEVILNGLNELKGLQVETVAELDALPPTVLDRAFAGI